jgi:hypothetical protein
MIAARTIAATNCTPDEAIDMVRNIEGYFHGLFNGEIDRLEQRYRDHSTWPYHRRYVPKIILNSTWAEILKSKGLSYARLLDELQTGNVK